MKISLLYNCLFLINTSYSSFMGKKESISPISEFYQNEYSIWKGPRIPLENVYGKKETSNIYHSPFGSVSTPGFTFFKNQPGEIAKPEASESFLEQPRGSDLPKEIVKERALITPGTYETMFPKLPSRSSTKSTKEFNEGERIGFLTQVSVQRENHISPTSDSESKEIHSHSGSIIFRDKAEDLLPNQASSEQLLKNKMQTILTTTSPEVLVTKQDKYTDDHLNNSRKSSGMTIKESQEQKFNKKYRLLHTDKVGRKGLHQKGIVSESDEEARDLRNKGISAFPGAFEERFSTKEKPPSVQSKSSPTKPPLGENSSKMKKSSLLKNQVIYRNLDEHGANVILQSSDKGNSKTSVTDTTPLVSRTQTPTEKISSRLLDIPNGQALLLEPASSSCLNLPQEKFANKEVIIKEQIQAHVKEEGAKTYSPALEILNNKEIKNLERSPWYEEDTDKDKFSQDLSSRDKNFKYAKPTSKRSKNSREKGTSGRIPKDPEHETSESKSLYSQLTSPMTQSQIEEIKEELFKIPEVVFLRYVLKNDDKQKDIKIDVTNVQFEYVQHKRFLVDKQNWVIPILAFQDKFGDIEESYRRILVFHTQCIERQCIHNFEYETNSLSPSSLALGRLLKLDTFFPDFADYRRGEWKESFEMLENMDKKELNHLVYQYGFQLEKRRASIFMMTYDDTYKDSKFIQEILSSGIVQQGAILSLIGAISHALDLSSDKANWKPLKKAEVESKFVKMINAMNGRVILQNDATFCVYDHSWVDGSTRFAFVNEKERTCKIFQERLKMLAILCDKMGIQVPHAVSGEDDDRIKSLSAGEVLIATHVGLKPELLIEFKAWLKSNLNQGRKSSRVVGHWNPSVPKECLNKSHIFGEYYQYRKEKIGGLEKWNQLHPLVEMYKKGLEFATNQLNTENMDKSIEKCLTYLGC
ncbi:hypothetical protein DFH28DRAFT_950905 [Melampsora americana]|nr:hypothetical protein DFH28DRAFT_950905 [Melampsora americana]